MACLTSFKALHSWDERGPNCAYVFREKLLQRIQFCDEKVADFLWHTVWKMMPDSAMLNGVARDTHRTFCCVRRS